jgi:hypothetical protein
MDFHFLFEQSGTFKSVFKSFGHNCYDYDILNEHGETDFVVDLFKEIEKEYDNIIEGKSEKTIFTNMTKENDFIIAFFPCTHFCDANSLQYRLLIGGKKRELDKAAVERLIKRNRDRARFFEVYLKFCFICKEKGIRTIIENPASGGGNNYLEVFSPIDVAWKEKNRALFGDDFKKPTNYFAINFAMEETFYMFCDNNIATKNIYDIQSKSVSTGGRSIITKTYAKNFYLRFIENNIKGEIQ